MPGVLVMEALAQVGAVICLSLEQNKGKTVYFGGVNKARFRNKVIPGDVLTLEVEIIKCKGPLGVGMAKAYDGSKIFAEGEITFMVG